MAEGSAIRSLAPGEKSVIEYDRRNLALYAALLEAEDAGHPWEQAAASVLRVDPDQEGAQECWRSHLDRARWIVGDGLSSALQVFNHRGPSIRSR